MNKPNRKKGENEAMQILKNKGYIFDESYHDDGTNDSIPDLKFANGRFLEVTHTCHNNSIATEPNLFSKKDITEQLSIMYAAKEAYDRIQNVDYELNDKGDLTEKGLNDYHHDAALVKSHYGYDCTVWDFNKRFSEFKCDTPIIEMTSDNILREIGDDKGKKHTDGNTDLFIFILDGEMNAFKHLLKTRLWNSCSNSFFKSIIYSPFKRIYLCEWDFCHQRYNIENPELFILNVIDEGIAWWKL